MQGQNFIQNSVMLRGRENYREAIAVIADNIEHIDRELCATAWREAMLSAEALGETEMVKQFEKYAEVAERHAKPFHKATEYGRAWAAWE